MRFALLSSHWKPAALLLTGALLLAACGPTATASPTLPPSPTATITETPTSAPTQTPYVITATTAVQEPVIPASDIFFLSLLDFGNYHLYAYSPSGLPLTRITADAWDDITPALNPTGDWLAFSSHRNGYWDLYLLDLQGGGTIRLTDTLDYDAFPSWSPDGAWLVYESYQNQNLDLFIRSATDPLQAPIQLTSSTALDQTPVWSPLGRQIAFVSDRSGEPEIWIADLDRAGDERFTNISRNPDLLEAHPAWSPNGSRLAWSAQDPASGLSSLYIWDARSPELPARQAGGGAWPVWQDNNHLVSTLEMPNESLLVGYGMDGTISLPTFVLPGIPLGLSCGIWTHPLPGPFQGAALAQLTQPYPVEAVTAAGLSPVRTDLSVLPGVEAPYPRLHSAIVPAFQALRDKIAAETGWDVLAGLENAFLPFTTPLDPGMSEDWLYTGRAISLNPGLISAGWMIVQREEIGQQTYWHLFLRAVAQDGSHGMPLKVLPWDFTTRTGSSAAFEHGGSLAGSSPSGYWVDATFLARALGWDRIPALVNWQTYYSGAQFSKFVFDQGLDWRSAMLQLYPPEMLITPTALIPPTRTPTRTPLWFRSPTPTRTPTLHPTSTP
jgi:TolB protein